MHGLINRALQRFAEYTRGLAVWSVAAQTARPGLTGFEAMLDYDDALTFAVLDALAAQGGTPREMLLEDLGIYLVSHPNTQALRRLLRFGGDNFTEFLYSLEDLPDRVRLAVPDLTMPVLVVAEHATGRFTITAGPGIAGFGHVLSGLLRAMADDYGALALVELLNDGSKGARLSISVAEAAFAEGRGFDLAQQAVRA